MTRSVWKGPFVDGYLLKKAEDRQDSGRKEVIKTWSRRSTIMPQFVGLTFGVHNGQKHVPVLVSEDMVGHEVRRVLADPQLPRPRGRQEGQEEVAMSKQANERRAEAGRSDGQGRARCAPAPRKLNLVAQSIRGLKVQRAPERARIQPQAHRHRRAQGAELGDLQRREQPQPRHRQPDRGRSLCRQEPGDEAFLRPRAAAGRRASKSRSREITIVVRELGEAD